MNGRTRAAIEGLVDPVVCAAGDLLDVAIDDLESVGGRDDESLALLRELTECADRIRSWRARARRWGSGLSLQGSTISRAD